MYEVKCTLYLETRLKKSNCGLRRTNYLREKHSTKVNQILNKLCYTRQLLKNYA